MRRDGRMPSRPTSHVSRQIDKINGTGFGGEKREFAWQQKLAGSKPQERLDRGLQAAEAAQSPRCGDI